MARVLVLVTTADGGIDKVSLQAMTLGSTVAAGGPVHALLIGDGSDDQSLAAELGEWGAAQVHVASHTVMARAAARAGLPFAANCTAVNPGSPVTVTRLRWGGSLLEEAAAPPE